MQAAGGRGVCGEGSPGSRGRGVCGRGVCGRGVCALAWQLGQGSVWQGSVWQGSVCSRLAAGRTVCRLSPSLLLGCQGGNLKTGRQGTASRGRSKAIV